MKTAGLVLVIAGVLALIYGGFTYTKKTHDADLGPIKIGVKEKDHVNIPVWAGVAAIIGGALIIMGGGRRSSV